MVSLGDVRWTAVRENRPAWWQLALFLAAFLLAASFGQWLAIIPDISIILWPPNGLYIATLVMNSRTSWPWWILTAVTGELICNAVWFKNPIYLAIPYAAANALEALAAAWLLAPFFPRPVRLATLRQVLALVVLGVLVAPVIAATIIATNAALIGKHAFATAWLFLWVGDATGILIAAPLTLVLVEAHRNGIKLTPPEIWEAGFISLAMVGVSAWVLGGHFPFAYMVMPPLLWAAVRFELRGTALAVALLAFLVALYTSLGLSPFAGDEISRQHKHMMMQLFLAVSALTGLIVAAIANQHRHALAILRHANDELERRVAERTTLLAESEKRFRATFENAAIGIALVSRDGMLLQVNDSFADILGYSPPDLSTKSFQSATGSTAFGGESPVLEPLLAGTSEHTSTEARYTRHDGTPVWANVTIGCVRRPDGTIDYFIVGVEDITERKKHEQHVELLMRQVDHRSKNMLRLIQAIARQTAANSPEDFVERFGERIQALSAAQDLLVKSE